jgi:nicotinate phosphoribosyltransferase
MMLQAYLDESMDWSATFELFVRRLPPQRNFLVAAGLEQALAFLETLSFSDEEVEWVERQGGFSARLLDSLKALRFTGDVHAMAEGTPFFAGEPILRVTAPLPQAQFVESRLLNIVHFQTLIASKAARVVLAAPGKLLVDFGMRRAYGAEAALYAARAGWLAGLAATATAEAGRRFGIPVFGTMAHSFVQAHDDESAALAAFARARPQRPMLLVDTYDTEAVVAKFVALAPRSAPPAMSRRWTRSTSCRAIPASRGASTPKARPPGRASSRCAVGAAPTGGCAASMYNSTTRSSTARRCCSRACAVGAVSRRCRRWRSRARIARRRCAIYRCRCARCSLPSVRIRS